MGNGIVEYRVPVETSLRLFRLRAVVEEFEDLRNRAAVAFNQASQEVMSVMDIRVPVDRVRYDFARSVLAVLPEEEGGG